MIQVDAMVREDIHTVRIIASLVIYAVLMFLGLITVLVGILIHGGWHDDGSTDDQSRTGKDASLAEAPPRTTQREGQDPE